MLCDVCNASLDQGQGEWVTADAFRYLLNNGFGIHESNIEMVVSAGVTRDEAIDILRRQYTASSSDWLLCGECAREATAKLAGMRERWIDAEHVAVTRTAEEVGHGFHTLGAPVALTKILWTKCVEWTEEDTHKQCYQEQDARLWDVLATGGATLQLRINLFFKSQCHKYTVLCIPRDGVATEAVAVRLVMRPKQMHESFWLVINLVEP